MTLLSVIIRTVYWTDTLNIRKDGIVSFKNQIIRAKSHSYNYQKATELQEKTSLEVSMNRLKSHLSLMCLVNLIQRFSMRSLQLRTPNSALNKVESGGARVWETLIHIISLRQRILPLSYGGHKSLHQSRTLFTPTRYGRGVRGKALFEWKISFSKMDYMTAQTGKMLLSRKMFKSLLETSSLRLNLKNRRESVACKSCNHIEQAHMKNLRDRVCRLGSTRGI